MNPVVLVVDDDRDLCEVVAAALALEGFRVRTALDAEAALEIADDDVALVLLDVCMPGLEAREFARRYREHARSPAPIVVFSASRHAMQFGYSIGAADVLRKPFELGELLALASRYVRAAQLAS